MIIRQQAFLADNKMLKGGLHIHTTRSDGRLTPEEVIKLYKEQGFDFLAITDHRNYNLKNFAPEEGVTIIPGMEFDNGVIPIEKGGNRCFHSVCLGPSKEDGNGFEQDEQLPSAVAMTQEEYQPYLDEIHAKNNLTVYCHPEWSWTPARYFERLKGNFAMEIWNTASVMDYDVVKDAAYWDELLGQGIRIWGVATDDGHERQHYGKGWVVVNAKNEVNDILKSLEEGAFYSSCGPEIYDFYIDTERGRIVVDCSPVAKVRLTGEGHGTQLRLSEDGTMTHAEMNLRNYHYLRITIEDKEGRRAWTNPIFLK